MSGAVALLLVDVINHMQFPGGDALADRARAILEPLRRLRAAARRAGAPVIYANDVYGQWSWAVDALVRRCTQRGAPGAHFTARLAPGRGDCFVLKARNSAFSCTALEPLLEDYGVRRLVLAGLTAENCVLFTAHDAYLRRFRLVVPSDGVASMAQDLTTRALQQMRDSLKADVRPAATISFTRA